MKRTIAVVVGILAVVLTMTSLAQVANEGLANGIIVARQKNAALLKQYNWNCRTDMTENGNLQDLRINLVNMGPDGTLQKQLLSDQEGALPNGFLRKAAAENKRKELEQYVGGVMALVEQYTLPNPGAVVNFLSTAQVQPVTTAGKTVLQINGSNVITPGDTFSMTIDGQSLQPVSIQVNTFYNGDPVTISGTFKSMKGGPNHLQYATVIAATKNLSVAVHNFDYVLND
ncbi:MAG TPA: hypothetical protein VM008_13950 [Phycisphaerae bacterium]|nr:hypothetical protein [Phycisphaerae bacterium]